jgi:hypothetical protein
VGSAERSLLNIKKRVDSYRAERRESSSASNVNSGLQLWPHMKVKMKASTSSKGGEEYFDCIALLDPVQRVPYIPANIYGGNRPH